MTVLKKDVYSMSNTAHSEEKPRLPLILIGDERRDLLDAIVWMLYHWATGHSLDLSITDS